MKIFEKARCNPTGMIKPFNWEPLEVVEQMREISNGHGQYGNQTEFCLEVMIGCRFFANQSAIPAGKGKYGTGPYLGSFLERL